jgi:hypothetical protein
MVVMADSNPLYIKYTNRQRHFGNASSPRQPTVSKFETHELVRRAVSGIKSMAKIEIPKIQMLTGQMRLPKPAWPGEL